MAAQQKVNIPKDASVIISILKDMGVTEYENRVINQLLEFTYRYVTTILDDSRVYANHAKKKNVDVDDAKLAIALMSEISFTTPPHRDLLLDISRSKNTVPLPLIKPHCGIRLPPDRYCLMASNYKMMTAKKPPMSSVQRGAGFGAGSVISSGINASGTKTISKQSQMSIIKRQGTMATVARTQSVTVPKPVIKFSSPAGVAQKVMVKPKLQMASGSNIAAGQTLIKVEADVDLKRKRGEESD